MSSGGSMVQQMPTYSYGYGYGTEPFSAPGFDVGSSMFSVPPPSVPTYLSDSSSGCSMCTSCGQSMSPSSVPMSQPSPQSEDEKIFALQLKAAAIFNKTDVPPPNMDPLNLTQIPNTSYPPPLSSIPSLMDSADFGSIPNTSPSQSLSLPQGGCSCEGLLDGETSHPTDSRS